MTDLIRFHKAKKRGGNALLIDLANCGDTDAADGGVQQLVEIVVDGSPTASQFASLDEAIACVHVALARLSVTHRKAIEFRYLMGLSIDEVALRLDCTVPASRGLCYRAILKLRELVGSYSQFFSKV